MERRDAAVRFLRQLRQPSSPPRLAKSGSAAGSGVWASGWNKAAERLGEAPDGFARRFGRQGTAAQWETLSIHANATRRLAR